MMSCCRRVGPAASPQEARPANDEILRNVYIRTGWSAAADALRPGRPAILRIGNERPFKKQSSWSLHTNHDPRRYLSQLVLHGSRFDHQRCRPTYMMDSRIGGRSDGLRHQDVGMTPRCRAERVETMVESQRRQVYFSVDPNDPSPAGPRDGPSQRLSESRTGLHRQPWIASESPQESSVRRADIRALCNSKKPAVPN